MKLSLLVLTLASMAFGNILEFRGTPLKKFEESGVEIPFYAEALLKLPGVTTGEGASLKATGAGLREKKIVFVNVNVYFATHYADVGPKLPEEPMALLKQAKFRVIQLTMLRDLSAEKIRDSFADALKANSIDTSAPGMASLLSQISFDVKKGQTITFAGHGNADGTQTVAYELLGKTYSAKDRGLADDFWSIWFGKPNDGGLERLKAALSGG